MTQENDPEHRIGQMAQQLEQLLLHHEIERLLYREARLLDDQRFHEWLDLFTVDVRYWVPIRSSIHGRPDGLRPEEVAISHMDETKEDLELRVRRLDTGVAWAEVPPSRTRRLISNVEVIDGVGGHEVTVSSDFLIYQSRREGSDALFSGKREDCLRRVDGQWKIARRTVLLDHTVLPRSVSIFF